MGLHDYLRVIMLFFESYKDSVLTAETKVGTLVVLVQDAVPEESEGPRKRSSLQWGFGQDSNWGLPSTSRSS
jgi:hypothetical protein